MSTLQNFSPKICLSYHRGLDMHFLGSLRHTEYEEGYLFDKNRNYCNFSLNLISRGQKFDAVRGVGYFGEMVHELPSGLGILISKKGVSYLGTFDNGVPRGKGIVFKSGDDGFDLARKLLPATDPGQKRRPSIKLTSAEGRSKQLLLENYEEQQLGMISLNIRFVGIMSQGQACSGVFEINDKIYVGFKPQCLEVKQHKTAGVEKIIRPQARPERNFNQRQG